MLYNEYAMYSPQVQAQTLCNRSCPSGPISAILLPPSTTPVPTWSLSFSLRLDLIRLLLRLPRRGLVILTDQIHKIILLFIAPLTRRIHPSMRRGVDFCSLVLTKKIH